MKNIEREDIYILSRHSSLAEQDVDGLLKRHVYNQKVEWQKFLKLLCLTLGVGFAVSGIIFFFAYNWDDLHKFVKIGMIEGLIIITTTVALLPKISPTTKNIILTTASALVGVLFAVFGQVYQTGADAYDFFLVWTLFVILWVVISNFAPLWLLFMLLVNTTFILYSQQVATDWSFVFVMTSLFCINIMVLFFATVLTHSDRSIKVPDWFLHAMGLVSICCAVIGIVIGIHSSYDLAFYILILLASVGFTLGIWQAFKTRSAFYLAAVPFGLIIIASSLLIKISDDFSMFLVISLFVVVSVTLVIKNLINLQKKWSNEN